MADAVKGKQLDLYPAGIARGIRLHRHIDTYTDTHPVVAQSKARLRPRYKKFAPVIADMFYDHFLARNFQKYADVPLSEFVQQAYSIIEQQYHVLPDKMQQVFPYMKSQNWLESYAEFSGLTQAFEGMSRRASFISGMETAGEELEAQYDLYQADFEAFFPDLEEYVADVKSRLYKNLYLK